MANRKTKSSFGRDSFQSRGSVGASASKLPRSTPLMHSSKKVLPSHSKSVSKRSSYFGSGDHHVQKDTRPLSDKSYMRKCINELLAFLTDMGYPHPLTYKMMNPPTNKEYFRIIEFVYGLISPGYKMMVRPEEETAKILLDLNYPCNISKSTLNNIGAMSAWPNALGALDWLVDLVKYVKSVEQNEMTAMIYSEDTKKEARDGYLHSTYIAFMRGENAPFTEIDNALEKQIAEMNKDLLAENEVLKKQAAKQDTEKKAFLEEKEVVASIEQEILRSQKMSENLTSYLKELDKYTLSVKDTCTQRETKLREMEDSIAQLERSNKDIQSTVTGQEISVAEVQNMQIEVGEIENKIAGNETRCKQLQEQHFAKQIEQSKLIDQISLVITEFVETCKQLELIPLGAPKAEGIDYSLSTDRKHLDKNVDKLYTVIRPKLMEMKSTLLKETGKLQQERNRSDTMNEQLKEEVADKKRAKDDLQAQLNSLRTEEDQLKTEMEKAEEKERQYVERLKEEIKGLKMINSLSLDDVKAQSKAMREKLKETESLIAKEQDELAESLIRICAACMDYKKKTQKLIQNFNDNINATSQKYLPSIMKAEEDLKKDEEKLKDIENEFEKLQKDAESLQV